MGVSRTLANELQKDVDNEADHKQLMAIFKNSTLDFGHMGLEKIV